MKLENIKKGWVTTIIGSLFLVADLSLFIYPMFKNDFEVNNTMLLFGAFIGVGLLLSPDNLLQQLLSNLMFKYPELSSHPFSSLEHLSQTTLYFFITPPTTWS